MKDVCQEHGFEKISTCDWCAQPICEGCIEQAEGKRYCFRCLPKLPLNSLGSINESLGARGKLNVDPLLDDDMAQEKRRIIESKVRSDRELFKGIKNAGELAPEEIQKLRKKREEYEKMRERFNL
ncbi:MAG: hypothetical protein V1743_02130 [Nanoarchaeota archaeon]